MSLLFWLLCFLVGLGSLSGEECVVFGDCSSFRVRSSGRVVEMLASAVLELLGLNLVRKGCRDQYGGRWLL